MEAHQRLPISLGSLLARGYEQFAPRKALVDGGRILTYEDLGERARRGATGLLEMGLRHGDRVVLLSGNRAEFIELEHALFLSGLVRVALSNRLHPREVAHIISDCEARAIVAEPEWAERLGSMWDALPSSTELISFGDSGGPYPSFIDLINRSAAFDQDLPEPDDLVALLYTSGTTSKPKGAALTHANWVAMVRNSLVEIPLIDETDVLLHVAPLSHFSGYVGPTYFARGASHVILRSFDPPAVLEAFSEHGITAVPLVPTMLNLLLVEAEDSGFEAPDRLRTIVYGGSAIAPDRLIRARRIFGDVFVQFYGLSETPMPLTALSPIAHQFDPDATLPARLASAGRVNPFVDLRVVGTNGEDVPVGSVGEIVVRGDTVMSHYWKAPEATSEMIDQAGWAHTGDLGRFDDEGYLYIVDRKNDLIVSGGYNVYPTEVENVISTLPSVQEVAIIGVPDEVWGEAIHAVVVVRPGKTLTEKEVVDACQNSLAAFKKPRTVEFRDELPKTGSGKIKRGEIRAEFWAGRSRKIGG